MTCVMCCARLQTTSNQRCLIIQPDASETRTFGVKSRTGKHVFGIVIERWVTEFQLQGINLDVALAHRNDAACVRSRSRLSGRLKTRAETKTTMTTVSKSKLSPTVDPGFCGEQWQEKTPERGGDPDMSMSCCVCMETTQSLSSLSSISAAQTFGCWSSGTLSHPGNHTLHMCILSPGSLACSATLSCLNVSANLASVGSRVHGQLPNGTVLTFTIRERGGERSRKQGDREGFQRETRAQRRPPTVQLAIW